MDLKLLWHENVRLLVSRELLRIIDDLASHRYGSYTREAITLKSFVNSLKNSGEDIVLLMPQEVYVSPGERYRVDAIFGGVFAFDFKSKEEEFEEAIESAKTKYLPKLPRVKYYVVTNWDSWKILKVSREKQIQLIEERSGRRDEALSVLRQMIMEEIRGEELKIKIPSIPVLIEKLFTVDVEELVDQLKKVFNETRDHELVRPLFEAYMKIMKMLYMRKAEEGIREEFMVDLFIKHTLMQMMVMASLTAALRLRGDPVDICSGVLITSNGKSLSVALPYLNWWKIVYHFLSKEMKEMKERIRKITDDISTRAYLIDWELGREDDVFRRLYEILVEPETRRRIGEYYTPLWLVDMILGEFELRDKLVMDPFCGSGTFLVKAFYKKIAEGEDPDKAYEELIGLDINPLAVVIARAELIIAYRRVTGNIPNASPHIYHIDTLAMWFGSKVLALTDPEYAGLVDDVSSYIRSKSLEITSELSKLEAWKILSALSRIELYLAIGMWQAHRVGVDLDKKIKEYLLNYLRTDDLIENLFREVVENTSFTQKLAGLIKKYGDTVWATTIMSAIIPSLAKVIRPHIIVTNPPWVQMTEHQTNYAKEMRKEAIELLVRLGIRRKKAVSIVNGSDIACMALYKAIEKAREGIGFVMNREQAFYSRTPIRAGIILTYAVLRYKCAGHYIKLIDIDYDAFSHGIYPALIVVNKVVKPPARSEESFVKLCKIKINKNISKDTHLDDASKYWEEEEIGIIYDKYVEPALIWARPHSSKIAEALDVEKVVPKGSYIMGLLGGEKRKGREEYAGLVVENYDCDDRFIYIKLFNLSKKYGIPIDMMNDFGIDIYKIYYMGLINPFKCKAYDVLLSDKGEKELKNFLKEFLEKNRGVMQEPDIKRLENLIGELRVTSIDLLNRDYCYVIYRGKRIFTACVPEDLEKAVSESDIAYIKTKSPEKAYYYVGVLNYLAYTVIREGRVFIRSQYARPLIAIIVAGLSWKDTPVELRNKVSELSMKLSKKLKWIEIEYSNQKKALEDLVEHQNNYEEFKQMVSLLDEYIKSIGRDRLIEALNLVSASPKR